MSDTPSRVAVVTGGSRGIGRAVAVRLASTGTAVIIGYHTDQSAAEETVRAIQSAGGLAISVQVDVADEGSVGALLDQATTAFGGVDIIVHAAGKMVLSPVADMDLADFDDLQRTNLRGTFVVAQQAVRRVRDGGALITLSSSVVELSFPGYGAYAASKGAVDALTLILARELRGRNVSVNAVAPGPTATDLFLDGKDDATIARLAAQAPLERLGAPADIAEVVAFLVSEAGHWVNGQVVRVNGGMI